MSGSILIIAGEASGDLHGANLMKAFKDIDPTLNFYGVGGERMKAQGFHAIADSREMAVVGISEVILKLGKLFSVFHRLKKTLDEERPDGVVLIDYPDFNLRFAHEAKKRGIPVVYYIGPQVWAWRRGRLKKIARIVDKMLVVFPFEKDFYKAAGVDVEYVGHPLADTVSCKLSKNEALSNLGMNQGPTVALLPGSRRHEVERLFPVMLEAAALIKQEIKDVQFIVSLADTVERALVEEIIKDVFPYPPSPVPIAMVKGRLYEALKASDAAIVTSGTATLETALMEVPMVIVYKLSWVTYLIARMFVGVEYIGLPNIVAEKGIVPELVQNHVKPQAIARYVLGFLDDKNREDKIVSDLREMRKKLGAHDASKRAAEEIYAVVRNCKLQNAKCKMENT